MAELTSHIAEISARSQYRKFAVHKPRSPAHVRGGDGTRVHKSSRKSFSGEIIRRTLYHSDALETPPGKTGTCVTYTLRVSQTAPVKARSPAFEEALTRILITHPHVDRGDARAMIISSLQPVERPINPSANLCTSPREWQGRVVQTHACDAGMRPSPWLTFRRLFEGGEPDRKFS